jgi:hypothetical protein
MISVKSKVCSFFLLVAVLLATSSPRLLMSAENESSNKVAERGYDDEEVTVHGYTRGLAKSSAT